jgi:hypothetical protein
MPSPYVGCFPSPLPGWRRACHVLDHCRAIHAVLTVAASVPLRHVGEHSQQVPVSIVDNRRRIVLGMDQVSPTGHVGTAMPGKERLGHRLVGGLSRMDPHRISLLGPRYEGPHRGQGRDPALPVSGRSGCRVLTDCPMMLVCSPR